MKKINIIISCFSLCFFMTSCANNSIEKQIVGTWKIDYERGEYGHGEAIGLDGDWNSSIKNRSFEEFVFYEDGTFEDYLFLIPSNPSDPIWQEHDDCMAVNKENGEFIYACSLRKSSSKSNYESGTYEFVHDGTSIELSPKGGISLPTTFEILIEGDEMILCDENSKMYFVKQ